MPSLPDKTQTQLSVLVHRLTRVKKPSSKLHQLISEKYTRRSADGEALQSDRRRMGVTKYFFPVLQVAAPLKMLRTARSGWRIAFTQKTMTVMSMEIRL